MAEQAPVSLGDRLGQIEALCHLLEALGVIHARASLEKTIPASVSHVRGKTSEETAWKSASRKLGFIGDASRLERPSRGFFSASTLLQQLRNSHSINRARPFVNENSKRKSV
jgi:hypothetical protein